MKILILILIYINFAFSSSENISLMNAVKDVIQKEEYISLALNKYILQTATIPKNSDNSLDWTKLETAEYLGTNFNKTNPLSKSNIVVFFDSNNSAFIKGAIETTTNYNSEYNYLYNFYTNKVFRVNTIPPINITKDKLALGSQVLYNDIQKEIVSVLNETTPKDIKFPNQTCTSGKPFYELENEKLTYKYCKTDIPKNRSFEVYQEEPIYTENDEDLQYIIAEIGAKAYVKIGTSWYEKYFIGLKKDGTSLWSASETTGGATNEPVSLDGQSIEQKLLSYIPNSKDLMLRRDGGCMLANGDIFCWGNNQYKKAGIETYGQLDTTLKPYFVNTPVMLKVQINDSTQNGIKWYNNPYRVKFQKMAMNSTNVCAISPIFVGTTTKEGGDLYCNGQITNNYENITSTIETSILVRNNYFKDKTNGIYLKEIAMVEDVIAVLSDAGKIYTIGRNYLGALGIGSTDKFIIQLTPVQVKNNGQVFKKIFALRDIKTFGAIDSNNLFYIWGELPDGTTYSEPTLVSLSTFNPDAIFTNSKSFILKGSDGIFYRTNANLSVSSINSDIPSNAISASLYDNGASTLYTYANKNLELKGSDSFISCKESDGTNCNSTDSAIFDTALAELNTISSTTGYANFTNVSIYQLDTIKTEQSDNFESGVDTWKLKTYSDTAFKNQTSSVTAPTYVATESSPNTSISPVTERVNPTRILGRILLGYQALEKTYIFGSTYANNEVEIEFDFYEIDSWDMERFQILLNDVLVSEDGFIHDCHDEAKDTNDTGIYTLNLGTNYTSDGICNNKSSELYGIKFSKNNDEKYTYKFKGKLDSSGNLKVVFRVRNGVSTDTGYTSWSYGQTIGDESWGIDNVRVRVKETSKSFICGMTGFTTASQMYCWGNVGRSIPILSTSLYDVSKISTINKLFISQESDKTTQMSFDKYNNSGNLFLKYPTYIGGFDYPFYFK
ncbi:MAG: RCC1 domain-containing protein [Aliarcobacter sp.]|nr:RCC1 domain-containing protein [Aliarcobacter sp.]